VKQPKSINFDQRPKCYWDEVEVLKHLLHNFPDPGKRLRITKHWSDGDIGKLAAEMDVHDFNVSAIDHVGTCMPWETEIAVIKLDSVNGDTVRVRATKSKDSIGYRVVDEYGSQFNLQRQVSELPMTLQEMIYFLDQTSLDGLPSGISLGYNQMNAEYSSRVELRHFTSITSQFYPDLERHYEKVFENWVNFDEDSTPL